MNQTRTLAILVFDDGWVACSAGIAAGIDMSLHVMRRLLGQEVATSACCTTGLPGDSAHPPC